MSYRMLIDLLIALKTLVYQSLVLVVSLLPTRLAYRMACVLGRIRYRRQKEARYHLARAMQSGLNASPQETEQFVRKYFELKSWEEVETWHCLSGQPGKIKKLIEFHGLENLDQALAAGRGAVLCTGHFRGLFILMLGLAARGYKLNAIRRQPLGLQNRIGRWFSAQTTLIRHEVCKFLWMHPGNLKVAIHAAAALRNNEILLVLIDGRFAAQSVDVKLLRRTLSISSGPIVIAQTTGAPLLNLSLRMEEQGHLRHVATIGPAFHPAPNVAASVQHCVSMLEEAIVSEPASWTWFEERAVWDDHQK